MTRIKVGFTPGDLNGDYQVNATDVAFIIDHMLGKYHTNYYEENGDLNGDGKVNAIDVANIITMMLGR